MNVTGPGATPPPPPSPPIAPATAPAPPDPQAHRSGSGGGHARSPGQRPPEVKAPEPPPLRMLTVTEMRVMLGQLPANAALRPGHGGDVRAAYSDPAEPPAP